MFVDEVDIHVAAGDGGRGCLSFRREKSAPHGGPDGGNGGRGGSVYLTASPHLNTLVSYRFHPTFRAPRGAHGEGSNRTGRDGDDLVLRVPIGTVAYEKGGGNLIQIADLTDEGQQVVVAQGGQGGRGNRSFASSTNQAPRRVETGSPGNIRDLRLRLKLLADVGLVGFPNAGKSTFISRVSAARPKIADYPFTTLSPNLGVVSLSNERSFVVADVPGLIEGAHKGQGLGVRFLGHLERTSVLVHLVDVSSASGRDPVKDFSVIQRELMLFRDNGTSQPVNGPLSDKIQIVAANKIDSLDEPLRLERLCQYATQQGLRVYPCSAATGQGIDVLLEAIWTAFHAPPKSDRGKLETQTPA